MKNALSCGMLAALWILGGAPAGQAAPPSMTRAQVLDLGRTGEGYSYWWGHARWRWDGAEHGACSGAGCPDSCTHSGSYGADCSGFVGKAWQVPDPSDLTHDWHPYSTWHFVNQSDHWSTLDRAACGPADALVYNESGAGHIVLVEGGDPWGQTTVYEAKGCAYGVVHNTRAFASKYGCIRRDNLNEGCSPHCEGNLIIGADCGQGDCGAYGAYCHQDAGADPRCVFFLCEPWGEQHGCLDERTKADCLDGVVSFGDCSAYGAYCHQDPGEQARCVLGLCQPHGENHACLDARTIVDCREGDFTLGDCGAYAAFCHQSPGEQARCVSGFCIPDAASEPWEHTICLLDGQLGRCTADGGLEASPCPAGSHCAEGACAPDACEPACAGRVCGPDPVCGAPCGECPAGSHCVEGACAPDACEPDCAGRACGPDPRCGLPCGACPAGLECDPAGACRPPACEPQCGARVCGPDSACGASCGACADGQVCQPDGRCQTLPAEQGVLSGVVTGAGEDGSQPVAGAAVWTEGGDEIQADARGAWQLVLPAGEQRLHARAEGYLEASADCTVIAAQAIECPLRLEPLETEEPEEVVVEGGCASAGGGAGPGAGGLLLLCALLTLRARRSRLGAALAGLAVAWVAGAGLTGCGLDEDGLLDRSELARVVAEHEGALEACGDGPVVMGIDVSKWQGDIDWHAVRAAGFEYAQIRLAYGVYTFDEYFERNWAGARAAGVRRGAYQWFKPDQDPLAQAEVLLAHLTLEPGDLPPMVDVEDTGGQPPQVVAERLGQYLAHVEAATGTTPLLYTGYYFWRDQVGGATQFVDHPLWIAQYNDHACPDIPAPWTRWAFWQFTSQGSVPGIYGDVDLDRFNGDAAALAALAVGGDPRCLENPDFGGCDGSVITHCDENDQVSSGDCGYYGATCSTLGGHPHCVHFNCWTNLEGGEDGSFCVEGSDRLATCSLGVYSEGDCGAYGARCSEEGGTAHCVHYLCWSNLEGGEDGSFCVEGSDRLATCSLGVYSEGDCGAFGARCSQAGGAAHCVHYLCWTNLEGGEDGSFCQADGSLGVCRLGQYESRACAAGESCQAGACVPQGCTPACGQRACGPDPACGQSCGECPQGQACGADGQCAEVACEPDCAGRACGPDPVCGELCGACGSGEYCDLDGACLPDGSEEVEEQEPEGGCASAGGAGGGAWLLLLAWLSARSRVLSRARR
ncbi:MAG TPA: GH25 family lysozyme [Myxococcota bacterium]|nr:GH25 family lysozyme [Myxococcota bacterium]